MSVVTLYSGSVGLNNKVAPQRLPFSPDDGVSSLESSDNVLIDRTGQLVSRRGISTVTAGTFHSLFSFGDFGVACMDRESDTAIYRIDVSATGETTLTGVFSGFTRGARFDFCLVNGIVFYTNGYGHGTFDRSLRLSGWPAGVWPDRRTTKGFRCPPVPDHLGYNAGRIFFSVGELLFYTEYGQPGLYDPATNVERFGSRIVAIIKAKDGMYVSDEQCLYFLAGLDPHSWHRAKVTDYPVLEWGISSGTIDPTFLGLENSSPATVVATQNGPLVCMESGQTVSLIDKNVTLPKCNGGASIMVVDETLVIQSSE